MSVTLESRVPEVPLRDSLWARPGLVAQAAVASAIAVVLAVKFNHLMGDDAMITFRYSRNLANGLGFVFNPGERVLSTTTPLSAAVFSIPELVGVSAQRASVIAASGLMAATGFIVCRDLWRIGWQAAAWSALIGIPLSVDLIWNLGNEMPAYLFASTISILLVVRGRLQWALPIAALTVLIRPDGIVLLGVVFVASGWFAWRDQTLRRSLVRGAAVAAAGLGICAVAAQLYFGRILPVTLEAKRAQGDTALGYTFVELLGQMLRAQLDKWWNKPALVLLLVGLIVMVVLWRRLSATVVPLLTLWALLFAGAFALSKTPGHNWYAAPIVLACWVIISLGAQGVVSAAGAIRLPTAALASVGVVAVLLVAVSAAGSLRWALKVDVPRYRTELYRPAGEWLKANTPLGASVGTPEVGIIGYYSERRIIDFAGLIQPDVPANYDRALGFAGFSTYAFRTYRPDYVVLLRGEWVTLTMEPGFTNACSPTTTITQPDVLETLDIYACTYG